MPEKLDTPARNASTELPRKKAGIHIMVVEDDTRTGPAFAAYLKAHGHTVTLATTGQHAIESLARTGANLVFLDLGLPDTDGLDLLTRMLRDYKARVAILTGQNSATIAAQALKMGAIDYFVKPIEFERLINFVGVEAERQHMMEELQYHRNKGTEATIIGEHPSIKSLRHEINNVANVHGINILILGPTGAGKELVARSVAKILGGPFVASNCAAIAESVFEAELFGYEKGAFTGATSSHRGLFALADGGTLFLDEISEIPLALQAKLLRVIETRKYRAIGSETENSFSCTIVASSNHNRADLSAGKIMRQDLFYRLAGYVLTVPALSARLEDVPLLAQHVFDEFNARIGRPTQTMDHDAARILTGYAWPGNVRELRNVVETAAIRALGSGKTLSECLAESGFSASMRQGADAELESVRTQDSSASTNQDFLPLDVLIRQHIEAAMAKSQNNISAAARMLGISRATLRARLQ